MALFEWDDEYSVGVKKFDRQHKKIFKVINDLHSAMKEGKSKENMGVILKRLENYADKHFTDEEDYMEKYDYSDLENQKEQHEHYIAKISEFREEYDKGNMTISMDMMNFLKDWLKNHINGTDKKYSDFFEDKEIN